ncbi:MAG: ribosome recycling factor [Myxococcales bacterium]|nr:ribosome recycling factor [Myxococcales bacterium]MCB9732201.1 ribosome recycling factor [Deltaproteobacteria bacterium]
MLDEIYAETQASMNKAIEAFKRELTKLRTGRANLSMLDGIRVEYYGAQTPLNQVAALNVAEARLITIKPWDKSLLIAIEKAIVSSNLGITPSNDGEIIRLPIPPLTGELRQKLVKQLKKMTEDARVSARNVRRDMNQLVKDSADYSEDEQHRALAKIQTITDGAISEIDAEADKKEKEIMEV